MSPRSAALVVAVALVSFPPLLGAGPAPRDGRLPVRNWAAAPYWLPDADGAETGAREALGPLAVTPVDPGPLPFVASSPCRVGDTRGFGFSGPYGPPSLAAGSSRDLPMAGPCNIPASARAVSVNFTVTNTLGAGFLGAFPQGSDYPGASTLNFAGGQTLANAAVVPLSSAGGMTVVAGVAGFDLIVDVNGYYANPGTASSGVRPGPCPSR